MPPSEAADPGGRLSLLVETVTDHRREGGDGVVFEGTVDGTTRRVEYADRLVRLELRAGERDRLDELLGSFPVFKIKQPETRTADSGVVYVSAIADMKHAAEFIEGVFRVVHGAGEDYRLRVAGA